MAENTINTAIEESGAATGEQGQAAVTQEVRTYTEEDVQKLLQSETDKRVTQALAKQKREYDKKLSLTQLDGEARQSAERDMRIAEYEEQIKAFKAEKNKSDLRAVLATRGLSGELADVIEIGDDVEAVQKRVDILDKAFKAAVQAEVKARMTSTKPKIGSGDAASVTREEFKKMSVAQQAELYAKSPEVYKALTK